MTAEKAQKLVTRAWENGECIFIDLSSMNRLIGATEAHKILGVSVATIGNYVKTGRLTAYYVPESQSRRFWLYDVMALARKEPYETDKKEEKTA